METKLFKCLRRNNQKTVIRVRTLISRHRVFATLACAGLLSNQHENGQAIALWIAN